MGLIPVVPLNVALIIVGVAVAYTAISLAITRTLSNPKRMRRIQYEIKRMQKDMNDLMKAKAPNEQLVAKQKEFMPLMGEQMKISMKPMLVILPLLLILYYVLFPILPIGTTYAASGKALLVICIFGLGFAGAIIIMMYDRKKTKQEMKEWEAEDSGNSAATPAKQ